MKAFFSKAAAALVVCSVALLAACGGGDSAPAVTTSTVASANLSTPITAANATALSNVTQTFATGIPEFGTTGPTTLVFTSTGTGTATSTDFSVSSGGGVATGKVTFGSCIFNIATSTIPGLLAPPARIITIQNCTVNVPTSAGVAGVTTNRTVTFTLGQLTGTGSTVPVVINANGVVTIGGFTVGTVAVTVTTGAGG